MPPALDLRRCGWHLLTSGRHHDECVALAHVRAMDAAAWIRFLMLYGHEARRLIMLAGVDEASERARLLRLGFGEVLGSRLELGELEARALRLSELENMLPRFRQVGQLRLDLLIREAFVAGDPLGLHPREFGLLWRLADRPGEAVEKRRLIEDVWHLRFVPETNSLAVHVSRLRTKMRAFGVDAMLKTSPNGAYLLDGSEQPALPVQAMALGKAS